MSASIVEEKCLNDIVNFLVYEEFYRDDTKEECTKLLEELGYDLAKNFHCERLLQDMLNLNNQAVEIRYPYDKVIYTGDYSYKRSANPGIYQALESMNVWLSVCMSEPGVLENMESSKLYVTFEKMGAKIRHDKIAHSHGWSKRKCNEAVYS